MKQLKIVVPKGRLNKKVVRLLNDVGLGIETDERRYIPKVEAPDIRAHFDHVRTALVPEDQGQVLAHPSNERVPCDHLNIGTTYGGLAHAHEQLAGSWPG